MSRKTVIFIFAAAAILLLSFISLPHLGTYLVAEGDLAEADAMVILMGSLPARTLEGADVYRNGFVRDVIIVEAYVTSE